MKNNEKELRAEIERLQQENELKTGWISLISHNLKENFSSLLWLIESVENQTISKEDFFKLLPQVKQDAQKNLQANRDTENWLKTQMKGFEPQISVFSAHDLFLQLKEEFQHKLNNKDIDLCFKGDESLKLQTDNFLILFILKKIIDNAIKYSHSGKSIYLEVSKNEGQVILSITDFGVGMELNQIDMLFSFPSIITKGTQGEIGPGLGIKIVKGFVSLLLGKIKVHSSQTLGTTVSIIFPNK
ncbi:MAG: sensor histidine kinase [Flavobacteriaceae bacterium]